MMIPTSQTLRIALLFPAVFGTFSQQGLTVTILRAFVFYVMHIHTKYPKAKRQEKSQNKTEHINAASRR